MDFTFNIYDDLQKRRLRRKINIKGITFAVLSLVFLLLHYRTTLSVRERTRIDVLLEDLMEIVGV